MNLNGQDLPFKNNLTLQVYPVDPKVTVWASESVSCEMISRSPQLVSKRKCAQAADNCCLKFHRIFNSRWAGQVIGLDSVIIKVENTRTSYETVSESSHLGLFAFACHVVAPDPDSIFAVVLVRPSILTLLTHCEHNGQRRNRTLRWCVFISLGYDKADGILRPLRRGWQRIRSSPSRWRRGNIRGDSR